MGIESRQASLHLGFASDIVSRDKMILRADFFFSPLSRSWRSRQSVARSDLVSRRRCQPSVAAPNTYRGSVVSLVTIAESH
jgi:hypothetical protein